MAKALPQSLYSEGTIFKQETENAYYADTTVMITNPVSTRFAPRDFKLDEVRLSDHKDVFMSSKTLGKLNELALSQGVNSLDAQVKGNQISITLIWDGGYNAEIYANIFIPQTTPDNWHYDAIAFAQYIKDKLPEIKEAYGLRNVNFKQMTYNIPRLHMLR